MSKNALVTGASTGIGYAIVKKLVQEGYRVFGSVRKEEDAERLRKDFGEAVHPLLFDVTDAAAIEKARIEVFQLLDKEGLAVLVNNAGIVVTGPMQHVPVAELKRQFEVNVWGVARVTQAFLPLLGAQRPAKYPPGIIFNMSSVSGFITAPFFGPYAMSKYALESMSDALRRELAIYNIKVVIIEPGPIKTPIWDKAGERPEEYIDTDYAPILASNNKSVKNIGEKAIPASTVADIIYKAITRKKPKLRYIVAAKKWSFKLIKILPDRMIDNRIGKAMKKKLGKS